jgi:hypothetical protein
VAPPAWITWDLTSSVQDMVDGSVTNHGWLIRDPLTSGDFVQIYFHSKENATNSPYLEVEYYEPEWVGPTIISEGDNWLFPRIAVNDDYVHVVWRDGLASMIQYRRSTDGGQTWDPIQTLTSGAYAVQPRVAVSGQYVHVVWRGSGNAILYRRSIDNGANFQAMVNLSGAHPGTDPDVAADGSNGYVVWIKDSPKDVYYARSSNNGSSWTAPGAITGDGATVSESCPRVAASCTHAYVIWIEYTTPTMVSSLFIRSTNAGSSWLTQSYVWSKSTGSFDEHAIAAYDSYVYINAEDDNNGPRHKQSSNYGASFSSESEIGNREIVAAPDIDATAAVADSGASEYVEHIGPEEAIFYATLGCCSESKIGDVYGSTIEGDIGAASDGKLHAVCNSFLAPYTPNGKIFYFYRPCPIPFALDSIYPTDDSYVNDAFPNSNMGASTVFYVGDQNGNDPPQICRAYLKFDLSSLPAGVEIGDAWVYAKSSNTSADGIRVGAHYQQNDAWTEGTLTWNNQPSFNATATEEHHADHVWNCWHVTADVRHALAGDGVYSVVLKGVNEPDQNAWIGCSSKEESFPQFRPFLEIFYASDTCDCMPGDANGDGVLNVSDAVYLIAFIFAPPSPPPTPYATCNGDANCDCIVNVSDVVYLIAFIFGGGPPPCDCQTWLATCGPPLY